MASSSRTPDLTSLMMQNGIDDASLLQLGMKTSKPTVDLLKKLVQKASTTAAATDVEEEAPPPDASSDDEAPPKDAV